MSNFTHAITEQGDLGLGVFPVHEQVNDDRCNDRESDKNKKNSQCGKCTECGDKK